ncbi:MAG TPA: Na-translocating system protein MpsC family protein [Tissierellales bacterium]|nr:Na-translocating system protein MpsC family protein [Tissierellales bacterium]
MEEIKSNAVLNNMKVLLVEDDRFTRRELERFLKRKVGKLLLASSGFEGLNILDEDEVDIVITDLKMSNMDGLEMVKKSRQNGYQGPVIIISAYSDSDTILRAVDIGIVKYLVKPIDTEQMVDTMESLSKEILQNKYEKLVLNDFIVDREGKKEMENEIGRKVAYFLKSYTGKGPRNISIFIQGNEIKVKSEDVLTTIETNMISNNRNYSLVDYNRQLFYMENKEVLEKTIEEIVDSKTQLVEAYCSSYDNLDFLKFSII